MPTMYDVAARADVSVATVSAVLNHSTYVSPELTARVKQAVQELGYTINHRSRGLQKRATRTIGMLIPDVANPDLFWGQAVRGAEDTLRKKGYVLILGHTYNQADEQSRYLAAFRSRLVDGVILFQAPGEDVELYRLIENKRPIVFMGRIPKGIKADVVTADIFSGAYEGVKHLIARGHTRIGLITTENSMSATEFHIAGWTQALEESELRLDKDLIVEAQSSIVETQGLIETRCSVEAGRLAALRLLDLRPPPTALLVDNLMTTTGVLRALQQERLRCPCDVEILSSGDVAWLDMLQPPISTIVQPSYQLGVRAAELLLKRIARPGRRYETVLLKPELRIRALEARAETT